MKRQPWFTATALTTIASLLALPNIASAHQILELTGSASVKKSNWSEFRMMGVGTQLQAGDLIQASNGSNITVLCDDLTMWNVPSSGASDVANGCKERPDLTMESEYNQGGTDNSIPYVMTPRNTLLMNNQFTISWNPVANVTNYVVTVEGDDGLNWSEEVTGTETVYNGEQPLEAGCYYLVTVTADTGVSSAEDEGKNLGFVLMSENMIQDLETKKVNIENINLSDEGKAITLAIFYQLNNLNSDAITTLETLVETGTETPLVYQMLGDLYVKTGLNSLAEQSYNQAIELASNPENLEVLTNAQAGLAGVNIVLGNMFQAGKLAQQAEMGYQLLGHDHHAMMLEETLMTLMDDQNDNSMSLRATRGGSPNPFDEGKGLLYACRRCRPRC
jgi:hypothetical protein